jgi:hypothetical protein
MVRGLSHKALRRFAHDSVNEVLLHWLGRGHCATRVLLRTRKPRTPAPAEWKQFCRGNVVGIGFGAKESAGKLTGDLAARVYVRQKRARNKLSAGDCVPKAISGMATDVVAVGTPTLHTRPVEYGAGISHARGLLGSLGCVVTKPGDDARYILSACHVLAPDGVAQAGDEIVEPAMKVTGADPANPLAKRIGVLSEFEPLLSGGRANQFDAAIAKLDRNEDVSATIPLIGAPLAPMTALPFQSVRKYGAGMGPSVGVVMSTSSSITLHLNLTDYLFEDVIEVAGAETLFSVGGDSGALAVDALSRRAVCIVIGGFGSRTLLSPIKRVLDRFGVGLFTDEGIT